MIEQTSTTLPSNLTVNSLKAFRKYSDIEDFYRFVYENDIRAEASAMLNRYMEHKKMQKMLAKENAKLTKSKTSHKTKSPK